MGLDGVWPAGRATAGRHDVKAAMAATVKARVSRMLLKRVAEFLRGRGLAGSDVLLLAGVSGGPDSVCLLHALAQLQGPCSFRLGALHLDHRLRGAASAADAAYVGTLCRRLHVPLTSESADVAAYGRRRRVSLEEAGRELRYTFFASAARDLGAAAVLLGHTADDQAETVLMHLLRGSGITGLRGMEPLGKRPCGGGSVTVGRPLLSTRRRETEAYCKAYRLRPRADASNRSMKFLRNRIRHELLPLLRTYNPAVDRSLLRLAEQASKTLALLDREVEKVWGELARSAQGGLTLSRLRLAELPPALQAHALRRALAEAAGSLPGFTDAHVTRLASLSSGPPGRTVQLPGGLRFVTGYDVHYLGTAPPKSEAPALPAEMQLNVPGSTELPSWTVEAEVVSWDGLGGRGDRHIAFLNPALAESNLLVRARRVGDRFQPLGMARAKKLQDFLVDAKVPREQRDRVPLVCAGGEIVWVAGQRISETAKVPRGASRALRLRLRRRG